jgi:hypothetical protein
MRVDTPDDEEVEVNDLTAGDTTEMEEGNETADEETSDDSEDAGADLNASAANLTLGDISSLTGFPYVTVARYARENRDRLPGEGQGKARRYYPQAVEMIRELKAEAGARRGRGTSEETTHESGSETATPARSARKPRKGPRAPRVRRTPAIPTATSPIKRRGRPRKIDATANTRENAHKSLVSRGRVPRRNIAIAAAPPAPSSGGVPSLHDSRPSNSSAETAYRRAHLTAKLESLQEVMAHLAREHESLQMEIAKLT